MCAARMARVFASTLSAFGNLTPRTLRQAPGPHKRVGGVASASSALSRDLCPKGYATQFYEKGLKMSDTVMGGFVVLLAAIVVALLTLPSDAMLNIGGKWAAKSSFAIHR